LTLKEVLKHRAVDGKPYLSDIEGWLGIELHNDKATEIRNLLAKVQRLMEKNKIVV
jgi:hypothetical protein